MNQQQLDVAIDWLTVTSPNTADIVGLVEDVLHAVAPGSTGRPFRWMGYAGESHVDDDGHLAWGVKVGYGLVQMSGAWSNRVFRDLDAFRLANYRCTRLDLAVTVCLPVAAQLVKAALENPVIAQGNYTAITKTNGEGGTLYLGCRKSDQFGRLYDKGAEIRSKLHRSKIPDAVLWRYEVEYKRSLAELIRSNLRTLVQNREALDATIVNRVHAWYLARGISPTFQPGESRSSVVQVASRITTAEKTIDWLRAQVRPAIVRIAPEVQVKAILEALGVEVHGDAWIRWDSSRSDAVQRSLWEIDPEPL